VFLWWVGGWPMEKAGAECLSTIANLLVLYNFCGIFDVLFRSQIKLIVGR
jgi:hypothetical protein